MEKIKNKGGRPATGRVRTKNIGNKFSNKEIEEIKELISNSGLPISDAIFLAVRKTFGRKTA